MPVNIFSARFVQGSIRSRDASPQVLLRFQYNPAKIDDRRTVSYVDVDAPGQVIPFRQYVRGGDRSLSFDVEIAGALGTNTQDVELGPNGDISPELRKYQALLYPVNPAWRQAGFSHAMLFSSRREFRAPPLCVLMLGDRALDCVLTDLSIEETMFNADLRPVSASLRLTVREIVPYGGPNLAPAGALA